jgi:nucleoside-diphosphate-sugar epimerase
VNVLVTGSTGYLGRALVRQLVAEGHSVTNLGRYNLEVANSNNFNWTLGQSIPSKAFEQNEVLVHLAWSTLSRTTADFHSNVGGSEQLIKSAQKHGLRVVFVSSVSAINPTSSYGKAKFLVEEMLGDRDSIIRVGLVQGNSTSLDSMQNSGLIRFLPFIVVPGGNLSLCTTSVASFIQASIFVILGEDMNKETLVIDQVEKLKKVVSRSSNKPIISLPAKFSLIVLKCVSRVSQRGRNMYDAFVGLMSSQNLNQK